MPYRTFVDTTGTEWQAWDIIPQLGERRSAVTDRRVVSVPPAADRRRHVRRVGTSKRASLRGIYAQGWLCFDSGREKRRLSPIPNDWATCGEEALEAYVRRAEPVNARVVSTERRA
jgi:hypothetical protein